MRPPQKTLAAGVALATMFTMTACRGGDDDAVESEDPAEETAEGTTAEGTTAAGTTAEGTTAEGTTAEGTTPDDGGSETASECPASSPGLTDTSIKLGGTYPLSGPAAAYSSIPVGIDAWFQHLNETDGGFVLSDGSVLEIEWNYLDDGYSPPRAVENAKQLVEGDNVFLVLNPLGTPNNTAIREYMNNQEVPQLMVATGASKWGKEIEQYPWTIGYQPDYESEGIAYATYVLEQNPDAKIGILYQNDDFGADYLTGIKEGLGDKVDQIVAEVSYEVTDATIDSQVSQIEDADVDAFIAIVTPQFAIQTIQRKASLGWEPDMFIVSSVSSSVGAVWEPAGPENGAGAITSAYLKDPTDPAMEDDPGIVEYREVLAEYAPDANPADGFHVFGVSLAKTFEGLIEGIEGPICRQSIMDAVKDFQFENSLLVDGIDIETGPGDGFPIEKIQLKEFDAESVSWVAVGDVIDTASAAG